MISKVKSVDGKQVIDAEWLKSLKDAELSDWATSMYDSAVFSRSILTELRDAILKVLVERDICPLHWMVDECPIEVYGKSERIGGKYESELFRLLKENGEMYVKIKELERK